MSRGSDRLLAGAVFWTTAAFLWSFHPLDRPVLLDPATWDYMSIALLDGRLPYRDIFLHKTPGAAFVGALGAWLAPWVGLAPVQGTHVLFLFLGAAGPPLLFLLCRRSAPVPVALTAATLLVAFEQWPVAALEGARPKVATTVFGLLCLLAASRSRWARSGFWGIASAMCWQPGVAFLAGALWSMRRAESAGRAVLRLSVGVSTLVFAMLLWLLLSRSLHAFFSEAVAFNIGYVSTQMRGLTGTIHRLFRLLRMWDPDLLVLVPPALLGIAFQFGRHRTSNVARIPNGLFVAGLAYSAMLFLSLQAWPDTILLGPPLAAIIAVGLASLADRLPTVPAKATHWGALLLVGVLALDTHSKRLHPPVTYDEQARAITELTSGLGPADRILAIGAPEVLIHSGKHSVWPWLYLWFGVDRFAADHTPGGFPALLQALDEKPPARIFIARHWKGPYRRQFEQWAARRYRRTTFTVFPHTDRPLLVYSPSAGSDHAKRTEATDPGSVKTRP